MPPRRQGHARHDVERRDADKNDINIATAVLADATAKSFVKVVGVQWDMLDKVNDGQTFAGLPDLGHRAQVRQLPVESGHGLRRGELACPAYNRTMAPNDHAYGVESWGYIRDAIKKGGDLVQRLEHGARHRSAWATTRAATGRRTRCWSRTAATLTATPAYYVFRHFSQYVVPGARSSARPAATPSRSRTPTAASWSRRTTAARRTTTTSSRLAARSSSSPCPATAGRP